MATTAPRPSAVSTAAETVYVDRSKDHGAHDSGGRRIQVLE